MTGDLPQGAIAIIGMSGRFPGAEDIAALWRLVTTADECPAWYRPEDLARAGVPGELAAGPGYVPVGRPVPGFAEFDAEFFGVTPAEAELMDPQHRLLLQEVWRALEAAGHSPRPGDRTGVFAAASVSAYLMERGATGSGQVSDDLQAAIGNDPGTLAMSVSYKLGLTGPSFTVQSACSSALVAVHLAIQSLLTGECDLAVAGGVSVRQLDTRGYRYEEGAILSPDGLCRPFDASAAGTVPGDGVGVVVLRRLEDALPDGDHVHAMLIGSAVNNDGAAKVGFTAPSPDGQAQVIAEALAVAGVDPGTIGYVEAHGTGTPLGDPVEVRALTRAFGPEVPIGSVVLGSIKATVGHLDAAAGIAGLVKAVLALEHRYLPATRHFTRPHPELGLDRTPFRVLSRGESWPDAGHPARAGVSAFGVGGTNVHVVLQAAPPVSRAAVSEGPASLEVLPVSARTPEALADSSQRLADHLAACPQTPLADVAHTLQTGRAVFPYRRVVVCAGHDEAVTALRDDVDTAPAGPDALATVFLLPGQGSQYPGMGAQLHRTEPVFRAAFDECAELLRGNLGFDIREAVFAGTDEARDRLRQTRYTQPAMFALDYALARLLNSWSVRPDAMLGHSLGELVAACLAEVFTLPDALRFVAARAQLMQDLPPGRMLAVPLSEVDTLPLLGDGAELAAVNAPGSCVVAGPGPAVDRVQRVLDGRGVPVRELATSHAFHTALVEPALPGLARVLADLVLKPPVTPFLSNVTGTWITAEDATDPGYWVRHTRSAVRFADGVAAVLGRGPAALAEVGPGRALSTLVCARADPPPVVPVLPTPRDGALDEQRTARTAVGQLWRYGAPVDWTAWHAGAPRHRVPLPTYPFARVTHLLPRLPGRQPEPGHRDRARWTYAPVWHRAPRLAAAARAPLSWLVLAGDGGLAAEVADRLRRMGHRVAVARPGDGYARPGDDEFTVDPTQPGHLGRVVADLRDAGRAPDRVVHAWLLGASAGTSVTARYQRATDLGYHTLVELGQALGDTAVRIDVLTDALQDVDGDAVLAPERATVLGPVTVLPQEYPTLRCHAVDLPPGDADRDLLLAELLGEPDVAPGPDLVALRRGRRWRRGFAPVRLPALETGADPVWRAGGGYLVTGCEGTAGLMFAEHLAACGARLVLLRDRDTGEPRLAALLAAHPGRVTVVTASPADPAALTSAVASARDQLGRITGVLHLDDGRGSGLLALKTREQSAVVLDARVRGTLLLAESLRADELDVMLLHSATTGVIGGFGQAENTAVAAFLDACAHASAAQGQPVVSVDWGQWAWDDWFEQQMAALPEVREQYRALRERHGIPVTDGLAVAGAVLSAGLPQVVVSTVNFDEVMADAAGLTTSAFGDSLTAGPDGGTGDWDPAALWPGDELAQGIAVVWRDLLGIARIDPGDEFYDLGGNSLFAIQIVSRLRQAHGDFPMSAIFDAPTVRGLADAIRAHQAESIGIDTFEALLREVEGLSLDEAETILRGDE